MGREIERKFLVTGDGYREGGTATALRQGYLSTDPRRVVRVRLEGDRARLTIKGPALGPVRAEFEYGIPRADALELLDLCAQPPLEKTRYRVVFAARTWEVDEFHGDNEGLVVAECELADPDQTLDLPGWVGAEVTDDPRYANSNLVVRPFRDW